MRYIDFAIFGTAVLLFVKGGYRYALSFTRVTKFECAKNHRRSAATWSEQRSRKKNGRKVQWYSRRGHICVIRSAWESELRLLIPSPVHFCVRLSRAAKGMARAMGNPPPFAIIFFLPHYQFFLTFKTVDVAEAARRWVAVAARQTNQTRRLRPLVADQRSIVRNIRCSASNQSFIGLLTRL